jgi:NAD-dependent dihydropyrimidine dehydrogenase PreA subunit
MLKNAILFYFSGTGNTELIAKLYEKEFIKQGVDVKTVKVEDFLRGKFRGETYKFELMCIGYPVHALNAPKIIFDFIKKLPVGHCKKVFLFKTAGGPTFMNEGPASFVVKDALYYKGYQVFYEDLTLMGNNIFMKSDEGLVKYLYTFAVKKVPGVVQNILDGKSRVAKSNVILNTIAYFFSLLERIGCVIASKDMHADKKRCILCEKCVGLCPVGNIYRSGDRIKFGWKCILCMRCIYGCPQKAISPRIERFYAIKSGYDVNKIINNPLINEMLVEGNKKFKRFIEFLNKAK